MDSRERVFTALSHKQPDRIPRFNWFAPDVSNKLRDTLGLKKDNPRLLDFEFDHDWIVEFVGITSPWVTQIYTPDNLPQDGIFLKDAWGIGYKGFIDKTGGSYPSINFHPLAKSADFSNYAFPTVQKDVDFVPLKKIIHEYKKNYPIVSATPSTIFETSWYLRGFENFLSDLVINQDFAEELMDRVMQINLEITRKAVESGADIIWLGDDVGMETGMIISPQIWRKYLKPRYAKIISALKKINKDIFIAYHSDGAIEPVIPDFVEIGLDILNSLQPNCNDLGIIKKKFGSRLSFWGGVDVQHAIPFGKPEEVVGEVKTRISQLGQDGGFIMCASNGIEPSERIIENIFIYYWALEKYGKYPLKN
ncbi:MAG: hypothetical protein M1365_12670 [Actinobacteria bacterium]|nr:hypothetical protein [Actinomycetota bacterium]